ncbi:MAG: 1-(5-phosphoribosyl)-5-[(5-phosphoribosylamino)methylideneamino]imidazole-4-carboxamide isomerase [Proteobacteria bacterium]|jgi:phosphoribosylformimino-5-aminoimidazole carboxamide ribotide isomerase|nr:1-(5-phosphoribosyl)-5-[(5-phosphoribosylamino)methylideneamino]imidazole-4-carboxamide isomerase [Pseudomonadota bacterium]
MQVIPAIDLQAGKCVRLFQGDFDQCTEYSDDPAAVARKFQGMGFACLHIVDLDGARSGRQENREIVAAIARESNLTIQLGGGVRDEKTISSWLDAGVTRIIIGSAAVTCPESVRDWCRKCGADRIVLALDVRIDDDKTPRLTTHGWTRTTDITLWQCVDDFQTVGLRHVLCTDVSRDGAMSGPNADLYAEFVDRYPTIQLQASGGVRHIADLKRLRSIGADGAITGRALFEGQITEQEIRAFLHDA